MKRRFEYKDKKFNKFWEIELKGNFYVTYHGRIGTDGRESKKEFESKKEAKKEYKKIIKRKLKKGYKELGSKSNEKEQANKKISTKAKTKQESAKNDKQIVNASCPNNKILVDLKSMVEKLRATSSTLEKKEILSNYPQCKELLWWIYNPFKQFFVTSNTLKKTQDELVAKESYDSLIDLLKDLSNRKITGYTALEACNAYIRDHSNYQDLLYNIFNKDLKIRANVKLINQVWEDLIPDFQVALANKYENYSHKINFDNETWYMSRKLDGIRVITIIDEKGNINFYSRSGNPFSTLKLVEKELKKLKLKDIVLDGEMCIVDEDGNEDFTKAVSQIKRKDYTIPNPRYMMFDCIKSKEFSKGVGEEQFSKRIKRLKAIIKENKILKIVDQVDISSKEEVEEEMVKATEQGWEGLMLRLDAGYKGKRSNDILKVKKFHDAEYKVLDIEIGPFRIVKDGKEKTIDTMTNVIIEHKGNKVSVGSGFTLNERKKFKNHPEEIIGKIITVQYFEESTNQNDDSISLRFPIKKAIYEGKRDI